MVWYLHKPMHTLPIYFKLSQILRTAKTMDQKSTGAIIPTRNSDMECGHPKQQLNLLCHNIRPKNLEFSVKTYLHSGLGERGRISTFQGENMLCLMKGKGKF